MGESPLLCWVEFWMSTRTLLRKSRIGMPRRLPQYGCLAELAVKRREGIRAHQSVEMNACSFIRAKYESKKKNDTEEEKWGGTSH